MPKYTKFDEEQEGTLKEEKTSPKRNNKSSKYTSVSDIIVEEDDNETTRRSDLDEFGVITCSLWEPIRSIKSLWNNLFFMWMKPLLKLGNSQPLNLEDLYELEKRDEASTIYDKFYESWQKQLRLPEPSLAWAFVKSFGGPFFLAGGLKLFHDCLLFVGPYLLNKIISFLDDPDKPMVLGFWYVLALFVSQFLMSICLRQYFFWCFRCGMWLRSAVVTSVFSKALLISAGVLGRRTIGEISNLMSVDSTRLQSLTPYLHAIWYSFLQIGLACYFLWGQVGPSCLGGIAVIILVIPVTKKLSKYLGGIQKQLSKIRDRRVKLSNEALGGMKVVKFQAWEKEFQDRVANVRQEELQVYRKYIFATCMSSITYTSVPLLVSVFTFMAYVGSGNELDVATALTSLALFEILRFPLFMLPNVINNMVEAKVSVDRVQSFLLENEKKSVTPEPLWLNGVQFDSATLVYEGVQNRMKKPESELNAKLAPDNAEVNEVAPTPNGIWELAKARIPFLKSSKDPSASKVEAMTELEFELVVRRAQVRIAENHIHYLEKASTFLHQEATDNLKEENDGTVQDGVDNGAKSDTRRLSIRSTLRETKQSRLKSSNSVELTTVNEKETVEGSVEEDEEDNILTLYRVSMAAQMGSLLCIVGKVGSGKSSCLNALLGDMLCVLGKVSVRGSVSYVAQRPFIQNCSLKDNILFGRPLDEEKYQEVLEVCALKPDLKVLPAGDQTEIGERGINLSGGQKARVALARAVYADTDVVLLDDPLAAVDAHVAQHLFDACIMGTLMAKNKCVILVTNALQFVKDASKIVVLQDGCVVETGTFAELYDQYDDSGNNKGGQFYDMMQTHMESLNTADAARNAPEPLSLSRDISDPSLIPLMERLRSASTTSTSDVAFSEVDLNNEGEEKNPDGKNRSRTASNMSEMSISSAGSSRGKTDVTSEANAAGKLTKDEDREVRSFAGLLEPSFCESYYF